jgi:hypothetical protein
MMHRARAVVGVLGLSLALWAGSSSAQSSKDLVGAWITVSITSERDGKKIEPFGPDPRGIQIFDVSGRFAIIAMRKDLPVVASNNRQTVSAEESIKITRGSMAYFGSWTANDDDRILTMRIDANTFANFAGTVQKRRFTIVGDQLTINNPAGASGGDVTVILKRAQ